MIINISAKCSDCFSMWDENGREFQGYVPEFFGGGDYVQLSIDTETGRIIDWNAEEDEINEYFKEEKEEEEEEDDSPDYPSTANIWRT